MSLRDLDIDIDLDVNSGELERANRQVDELIASIRTIGDIDIDVDLGSNEALAELEELQAQLDQLNDERIEVDVVSDFNRTLQELSVLSERVNALDNDDIFIDVDLRGSTKEILMMRQQLRVLETQARHIDVDIDTAGAHAQLALLQAHINGIRGPSEGPMSIMGTLGGMMSGMASLDLVGTAIKGAGILAVLPAIASLAQVAVGAIGTLGVAIGVVGGGLLGLASAIGVAGIGVIGFGAIAISTITALYEEDAKLTASQQALKRETDSVVTSWNALKSALQPFTFDVITSGVKSVNSLLETAQPIMQNASLAVGGLFDGLNQSLKSDDMTGFFSYMERAVMPLSMNIGNGLGSALRGVLNTMTALEPLTSWVAQGFENMMGSFSDWTSGLVGSKGMESFMNYTKENLPKIGDAIGGMTDGIVDFFAAFGDSASGGLDWFADTMQDFAKWSAKLGENQAFQDMLSNIAADGPHIASTIGNITTNVIDLVNAISNVGKDENGEGGLWSWLDKLSDPKLFNPEGIAKWFSWDTLLNPLGKLLGAFNFDPLIESIKSKFSSIKINISEWFVGKSLDIMSWFKGKQINLSDLISKTKINVGEWLTGKLNLGASIGGFSWSKFIDKFKWPTIGDISLSKFIDKFKWPTIPKISLSKFIDKFKWPSLDKISLSKFVDKFKWPSLDKISLSKFVDDFKWPVIDKINLSSFIPEFHWPDMSGIKSSIMSKVSSIKLPGFSTGLGRVPNDMNATIHKNEAVIQADNAQKLRDSGILSGDGRHPTVNTNAVSTTSVSTSSVAPTNVSNASSGNTIQITNHFVVQGDGKETATSIVGTIQSTIEANFANFRDVFPAMREG